MLANLSSDLNSTMRSSKSISAASASFKAEQVFFFFLFSWLLSSSYPPGTEVLKQPVCQPSLLLLSKKDITHTKGSG